MDGWKTILSFVDGFLVGAFQLVSGSVPFLSAGNFSSLPNGLFWLVNGGLPVSKKSPTGPTERTPKPEYLIARSQLRGPLGFGPIQFLMEKGLKGLKGLQGLMFFVVTPPKNEGIRRALENLGRDGTFQFLMDCSYTCMVPKGGGV